jgi:NADPH2:quinone reductase
MQAIRVQDYGGPDQLRLGDVPAPEPKSGEVLVKLSYAGVNFIDVYMRSGVFKRSDTYAQTPPMVIGMEGAGQVAELGEGVTDFTVGDTVAYCIELGSYAEYAVVPAWKLVKVPQSIPLDIATALQLQGSTAHYLSHSLFPLAPGHTCLIHAGAGGLAQLLIQLAKIRGAEVFATVGSPEKAKIAKQRGADHVILYREVDFAGAVLEATGGKGVNVVYDSVGKDTISGSIRCCARRGVVSNNGNASGPIGALDPLELAEAGSIFFTRPHLADYMTDAEQRRERASDLFTHYRAGRLKIAIDRVLPLADARTAHETI